MKRIAIISLAVFLTLILLMGLSCDSDSNKGNTSEDIGIKTLPEGYSWHYGDEFDYKIAYPEGWDVSPEITASSDGLDMYQKFKNPEDIIAKITIAVYTEDDLEGHLIDSEGNPDYSDVLINDRSGFDLTREGYIADESNTINIKTRIVIFVVDKKYWEILCGGSEDMWAEYETMFDTAIRSFVIE